MKSTAPPHERLRHYTVTANLFELPFDTRRGVARDLSRVLQERAAYRLWFWLMLAFTCSTSAAFAYAVVYIWGGCR